MIVKLIITGLVQGIGYRPFVLRNAQKFDISGSVKNIDGIVEIYASGSPEKIEGFISVIKKEVPVGGKILDIMQQEIDESEINEDIRENIFNPFQIVESVKHKENVFPVIPADLATCSSCEKELFDKNNRRYRHPFISCVACGPRYSVTEGLPYDRIRLNLKSFPLCDKCKKEYTTMEDRRCFAQTISCKECGPVAKIKMISGSESIVSGDKDVIENAIAVLKAGGVLAIKDIGGYHLACDVSNKNAIALLRKLKDRATKPFAVMFDSVADINEYAEVDKKEKELLEGAQRPIVLLKLKNIFESLDGSNSPYLGAMLPSNPIQLMLIREFGPLIMTSANISGGMMITENDEMEAWLNERCVTLGIDSAVAILYHNREIEVPLDDSILRVICGRTLMVRRARGYAPLPVKAKLKKNAFAAGGDMKATFAFSTPGRVYLAPTLSDVADEKCEKVYQNEIKRMVDLFGFKPEICIADRHPGYISANITRRYALTNNLPLKVVPHHKAHIASVIAEHGLIGTVLGFAFDGTGYGDDGTVWGGEVFRFEGKTVKRVGHLPSVLLMSSDEAAKNCKAACMAQVESIRHRKALIEENPELEDEIENEIIFDIEEYIEKCGLHAPYTEAEYQLTKNAIDMNLNRIKSTSAGRMFDAVSSALGICQYNTYEGEAAMELEYAAVKAGHDDIVANLAWNFHVRLANYIIRMAKREGVNQVALAGGVFMNSLLTEMVITRLEEAGFTVYINEQVSCGDGSLALGQLYYNERGMI